jgi:hypothetical protein
MTDAEREIAELDKSLATDGEDIVLRRTVGSGATQQFINVKCRAFVRGAKANELLTGSGMSQTQNIIVISPTQINRAQWPGGQPIGQSEDPSIPKIGDKAIAKGRSGAVLFVDPIKIGDEIIRINMWAAG